MGFKVEVRVGGCLNPPSKRDHQHVLKLQKVCVGVGVGCLMSRHPLNDWVILFSGNVNTCDTLV